MAIGGFARLATAFVSVEAKVDRRQLKTEVDREATRAGEAGGKAFSGAFEKGAKREAPQTARGFGGALADSLKGGGGVLDIAENVGQAMGGRVGKSLILGVGAAGIAGGIALILGPAFGEALQQAKLGDKLAAQLDLTGPESERAGRVSGGLFSQAYGDSVGQVNQALKGVQENIGDLGSFTSSELEGMGAKALDLSVILEEDVGRVTRAVGQLIRNGLARNAEEAFDILTRGAQEGGNATDDLLDTIEEYSADLASLGLSGPEALGAVSAALEAGARNSDLAADALRELSIRAVDGSELTRQGFELAGLSAEDMADKIAQGGPAARNATSEIIRAVTGIKDPIEREAAGVALFGTRFEELGPKAVAAMDPVEAKLNDVGGAADRMGDKLNDNASTRIEAFKRRVSQNVVNLLGNEVIPALEDASDGADKLADSFADAGDDIQSDWKATTEFVSKATREGRRLWDRTIAGFIGTTTDGFARLRRNVPERVGEIRDESARRWRAMREGSGRIIDGFTSATVSGFRDMGGRLSDRIAAIRDGQREGWQRIEGVYRTGLSNVRGAVVDWGRNLVGWFRDLPGRITDAIGNIGQTIKDKFSSLLKGFSIPIKLAFGLGDGLGLGAVPGRGTPFGVSLAGTTSLIQSAAGIAGSLGAAVTSAFRPGSRTLSGNLSYHARGRGLDVAPIRAVALAFRRIFGSRIRELITPWRELDLHNGRPHFYSPAVHAQHSGSNAHIHLALEKGGFFNRPTFLPAGTTIAERQDEIVSPVPMLQQVMRDVLNRHTAARQAPLIGELHVHTLDLPQRVAAAIGDELAYAELAATEGM